MSRSRIACASLRAAAFAAVASAFAFGGSAGAAVVINEFSYDDASTDDREFIELYNDGVAPVDISGWTIGGRDATTVNTSATVPAATSIPAGGYYVFANTGTLNANQVLAANFLENDMESIELRDSGAAMVDAVIYESNKGITGNLTGSDLPGQVGTGVFGNAGTTPDTADNTTMSIGRFVNGRDTNNNGRDFGPRPSTPGTSNNTGLMTFYTPPDPTGSTVGTDVPGLTGSFVNARYIDPTVADANNTNAIAPAPSSGNRAIIAWDPSGGGNGATSNQVFATSQSGFAIKAYLDTADQPQNSNASGVNFTGSEITLYGVGGGDMLTNLTDLGGNIGIGPSTAPASDSANGFTGIAWIYEKSAVSGATPATQTLYLVDANDGGDSDVGGTTPLDWVILQTIDISGLTSGWFDLGIDIDSLGNGVASFNGQSFNFAAGALNSGAFNVGYRENLQLAADTTPDAIMRPPTFTIVPEPGTLSLLALGGLGLLARRRRA